MNAEELHLPHDTFYIIVHKGDDLYALDAPTADINGENLSIARLMDNKPMSDILFFLAWLNAGCPE